jgi:hypothetical protein
MVDLAQSQILAISGVSVSRADSNGLQKGLVQGTMSKVLT